MSIRERVSFRGPSGIQIAGDQFGPEQGPVVLLAHGGGQTRHAWRACGTRLGEKGYRAVAIDLRGHGESDWAVDGDYRIESFAEDLLAIADGWDEPPVLVGASLGGIAGMIAQGEYVPQGHRGFAGLILADIAPRVKAGGVEKVLGFMAENVESGFGSLDEAADAIARYLPHRRRPKDLSGLAKNLRKKNGRYYWHWDPRFVTTSQRAHGNSDSTRRIAAASAISVPILLVRGTNSEMVDAAAMDEFAEIVPHAEFADVSGAGHMVAGDRNDAFADAVLASLMRWVPVPAADLRGQRVFD